MEMSLQFGFGMMDHCRSLIKSWGGGHVILSPRDLTSIQLSKLSTAVREANGIVWVDPQFYLPRADHERLCGHAYWPSAYQTGSFWYGSGLDRLVNELEKLNRELQAQAFVLPCELADDLGEDWYNAQEATIQNATTRRMGWPIVATIALSDRAVSKSDAIGDLLERMETWEVDGVYLVVQHPQGSYFVNDPVWLANLLDLAAGIKLQGKKLVVGYCNQQSLLLSLCKADSIASGTWMNVRSFPPEKFITSLEDEIRQRSKWYYCPQNYSEYKIPFLDIAQRQGVLSMMKPPHQYSSNYADVLFQGLPPTTIDAFTEQAAFRHYLKCLRAQASESVKSSFDETVDYNRKRLDEAESLLNTLRAKGVRGGVRDFFDYLDVNRAALEVLVGTRGATLRRKWLALR